MKINFGYVAMSTIVKDCSPSKTITVKNLEKLEGEKAKYNKLTTLAKTNIKNTQRLLYHNQAHDIFVYRITSKLIPLATHPLSKNWNWLNETKDDLKKLGNYAKENNFRISAHPDHFTLLNSPKEEIIQASIKDLEYHNNIFTGMGLDYSAKLVMHIGGSYKNKKKAIEKFIYHYNKLPSYLKNRIILENDDKTYTAKDVLEICKYLKAPMVLDIHHHWCNNYNDNIELYLPEIFATWKNEDIPPKIHLSSPKSEKNFRSHADYIETCFFLDFLTKAKQTAKSFDVMIEAKNKDKALFALMEDLKEIPSIKLVNQASIEILF